MNCHLLFRYKYQLYIVYRSPKVARPWLLIPNYGMSYFNPSSIYFAHVRLDQACHVTEYFLESENRRFHGRRRHLGSGANAAKFTLIVKNRDFNAR